MNKQNQIPGDPPGWTDWQRSPVRPQSPVYEPMPENPNGCRALLPLTEEDIRRIVREEIAALKA